MSPRVKELFGLGAQATGEREFFVSHLHPDDVDRVEALIRWQHPAMGRLGPAQLELEITEGILAKSEASAAVLREISAVGVRLSIDDFGHSCDAIQGYHFSRPVTPDAMTQLLHQGRPLGPAGATTTN